MEGLSLVSRVDIVGHRQRERGGRREEERGREGRGEGTEGERGEGERQRGLSSMKYM